MNSRENAVQKAFVQMAEELGCMWEKVDQRFEKFLELYGRRINLRIYWYFERDAGVFVTLVQPEDGNDRAFEISLYLLICYKTGQEDGPDHKLAGSADPDDLAKVARAYAAPYLVAHETDVRAVAEWARKRVLQQHPEYNKLKTNKWVRCEWI